MHNCKFTLTPSQCDCGCLTEIYQSIIDNALYPLRIGMLFYHEFNDGELGIDSSGNGSNLTEVNGPITVPGVPSIGGTAVGGGGDGTLAHLEKNFSKYVFNMSTNDWTISYWWNRPTLVTNNEWFGSTIAVLDQNGSTINDKFTLIHQGVTVSPGGNEPVELVELFSYLSPETREWYGRWSWYTDTVDLTLPTTQWHHIAIRWDSNKQVARTFINGVNGTPTSIWNETVNDAFPGTLPDDPDFEGGNILSHLNHGYNENGVFRVLRGDSRYYPGAVDELAMWSRQLSDIEIANLATGMTFEETWNYQPTF